MSGAEWVLIVSADETRADVTNDKHTSCVLMAIFEATAEVNAMATRCVSASQSAQAFAALTENIDSPSCC